MTNQEFIDVISKRNGVAPWAIKTTLSTISDYICEEIRKGKEISVPGIGSFAIAQRKKCIAKNLIGGGEKEVPPLSYPIFRISRKIKQAVKSTESDEN